MLTAKNCSTTFTLSPATFFHIAVFVVLFRISVIVFFRTTRLSLFTLFFVVVLFGIRIAVIIVFHVFAIILLFSVLLVITLFFRAAGFGLFTFFFVVVLIFRGFFLKTHQVGKL
ncbi:hypothetical protein D3C76_925610 [compost metagenome]